jgi:hypothetical protein
LLASAESQETILSLVYWMHKLPQGCGWGALASAPLTERLGSNNLRSL